MSHKSFRKGEAVTAIAVQLERMVKAAAEPVEPGDLPVAQIRRAWRALGKPDWWRVRAAWYGQAHEGWSVGVVDDLRRRFAAWESEQEEARARGRSDATAVLAALREQLATTDPDFHRETIAALDHALGAARRKAS